MRLASIFLLVAVCLLWQTQLMAETLEVEYKSF
jgi:hypothetical protein